MAYIVRGSSKHICLKTKLYFLNGQKWVPIKSQGIPLPPPQKGYETTKKKKKKAVLKMGIAVAMTVVDVALSRNKAMCYPGIQF